MSEESALTWDRELSQFFKGIGLLETSECLESELTVLSRTQLEKLPEELEKVVERLLECLERHVDAKEDVLEKPDKTHKDLLLKRRRPSEEEEDENKERIKRMDGEKVQIRATTKEVDQRIETFIQAKRNELDESNRTEFLSRHDPTADDVTCARTDAREINRNIQMKFDIVNNEDGPLARSTNVIQNKETEVPTSTQSESIERINNIEQHLNVKLDQNANPPFSLIERVKILENALMEIEREYPTWAAVHFNQPNRTFPPPPPITYITRAPEDKYTSTKINTTVPQAGMLKTTGRSNTSLTRAVIDQLNIHKQLSDAMSDSHT
ncbi:hypothetical protein BY458DRAFT_496250 [Sporodiniella umbellata]|nr:hypothetical protein BY458DRAFT_496250 [Sporodiniella umbellata]